MWHGSSLRLCILELIYGYHHVTFHPPHREACASTTKPLIEAVEALTTFASSSQFASTPAVIGEQACGMGKYG